MEATKLKEDIEKKMVLVVEDDPDMNELLSALMNNAGYRALSATDGQTGAAMAREHKPDLILMDIMLPGISGIDVCRHLMKEPETSGIPVIMVSAKRDMHSKLASFVAGARRYITKPFGIEEILDEVSKTFRQKRIAEQVSDYHDKCGTDSDLSVFPTDFEKSAEVCELESRRGRKSEH